MRLIEIGKEKYIDVDKVTHVKEETIHEAPPASRCLTSLDAEDWSDACERNGVPKMLSSYPDPGVKVFGRYW